MLKITIPHPCHENWDTMTPDETGRHCSVCAKSVIDFTNMTDEEVKHFFLNKKKEDRVCGRLKQTQLQSVVIALPSNIFKIRMASWKKFLAACLMAFSITLFSCETRIKGTPGSNTQPGTHEQTELTGVMFIPFNKPDTLPEPPVGKTTTGITVPTIVQGDLQIVEPESPVGIADVEPVKDTVYENFNSKPLIINDSLAKTKNPPAADSIHCKMISNYY